MPRGGGLPSLGGLFENLGGDLLGTVGGLFQGGGLPSLGGLLGGLGGIFGGPLGGIFGSIVGGLLEGGKTSLGDLPSGYHYGEAIMLGLIHGETNEYDPGGFFGGQIVIHSETGMPVGRWSYANQAILPLLGMCRNGYLIFEGTLLGGQYTLNEVKNIEARWYKETDKHASTLIPQAEMWVSNARSWGIPIGGGFMSLFSSPIVLLAVGAVGAFFFFRRKK